MYKGSQRYHEGEQAAQYLAVAELAMSRQAERAGVTVWVLRTLVSLSAMRASGASVLAADLVRAGLGQKSLVFAGLAECRRLGWVSSVRGHLSVLSAGRVVVADLARSWERSRRELARWEPARADGVRPAARVEPGPGA